MAVRQEQDVVDTDLCAYCKQLGCGRAAAIGAVAKTIFANGRARCVRAQAVRCGHAMHPKSQVRQAELVEAAALYGEHMGSPDCQFARPGGKVNRGCEFQDLESMMEWGCSQVGLYTVPVALSYWIQKMPARPK